MDSMRGTHHVEATRLNMGVMSEDSDHENEVMSARIKKRDTDKAAYRKEVKQAKKDFEESLVARAIKKVHSNPCATLGLALGVAITAGGGVLLYNAFQPNRDGDAIRYPEQKPTTPNPKTTTTQQMRTAFTTAGNSTATATSPQVQTTPLPIGESTTGGSEGAPTDGFTPTTTVFEMAATSTTSTATGNGVTSGAGSTQNAGTITSAGTTTNGGTSSGAGTTAQAGIPNPTTTAQAQPTVEPTGDCFPNEQHGARHARSIQDTVRNSGKSLPKYVVSERKILFRTNGYCDKNGEHGGYNFYTSQSPNTKGYEVGVEIDKLDNAHDYPNDNCRVDSIEYRHAANRYNRVTGLSGDLNRCGAIVTYPRNGGGMTGRCISIDQSEASFGRSLGQAVINALNAYKIDAAKDSAQRGTTALDMCAKFEAMADSYAAKGFTAIGKTLKEHVRTAMGVRVPKIPTHIVADHKYGLHFPNNPPKDKCTLEGSPAMHDHKGDHVLLSKHKEHKGGHELIAQQYRDTPNCSGANKVVELKSDGYTPKNFIEVKDLLHMPSGSSKLSDCTIVHVPSPDEEDTTLLDVMCLVAKDKNFVKQTNAMIEQEFNKIGTTKDQRYKVESARDQFLAMARKYDMHTASKEAGIGDTIRQAVTKAVCDRFGKGYMDCNSYPTEPTQEPTQATTTTTTQSPTTTTTVTTLGTTDGQSSTQQTTTGGATTQPAQPTTSGSHTTTAGATTAGITTQNQVNSTTAVGGTTTLGLDTSHPTIGDTTAQRVTTVGVDDLWTTTKEPTKDLPESAITIPQPKWKFDNADQKMMGATMVAGGGIMTLASIGALLWGGKKQDGYDLEIARKNSMRTAYKRAAQVDDNGYEGSDEEQAEALV